MSITTLHNPESFLNRQPDGTEKVAHGYLAGATDYAAGGFACDPATDFGITGTIDKVEVTVGNGYSGTWDSSAKKIIAYKAAGTQADDHTNFSAIYFFIHVYYHE